MKAVAGRPDILPDFTWWDVELGDVRIRMAMGGSGPPLLLLHGHPQTHLTWHRVAHGLARRFTVVLPDLRGYGDSSKPGGGAGHVNYAKRAMAMDQVALMRSLGFGDFAMVGHDRGARVAHRLALDHPESVSRVALLDVAPTATMYARTDKAFATRYFWWFFLIQPFDLPERLIGADPQYFLDRHLAGQVSMPGAIDPLVLAEYRRCYADPATRHAICEDYRAAAGIDLVHDGADAGVLVKSPILALWGRHSVVGQLYDVLSTWREKGRDVQGHGLECGHLIQEEAPGELLAALDGFL